MNNVSAIRALAALAERNASHDELLIIADAVVRLRSVVNPTTAEDCDFFCVAVEARGAMRRADTLQMQFRLQIKGETSKEQVS